MQPPHHRVSQNSLFWIIYPTKYLHSWVHYPKEKMILSICPFLDLCTPSQSKALVPRQHPPTPNKLNFWMIQSQIASKINRQTLLLLQALRWVSISLFG